MKKMSSSLASLALSLLLGIVVGWSIQFLWPSSRQETEPLRCGKLHAEEVLEQTQADLAALDSIQGERQEPAPDQQPKERAGILPQPDTAAKQTSSAMISSELEGYALNEIKLGWSQERPEDPTTLADEIEGLNLFENTVLESPRLIGTRLAIQRSDLDQAELLGEGFSLLQMMLHGKAGELASSSAHDSEAMASFFERNTAVSAQRGPDFKLSDGPLTDGATLVFPAGVFDLGELAERGKPFPRDITIRGAGMDQTLLFVHQISTRDPLVRLAIQDCTVFTKRGALMDLRRESCSMSFENVRFLGFDSGTGGCDLFLSPAGIFLARNCVFDASFGRSQSAHSSLFDIRSDGLLARFENCTFNLMSLETRHYKSGVRVAFVDCKFLNTYDHPPEPAVEHVSYQNSSFEFLDRSEPAPTTSDLNDLFPDWEARLGQ